MEEIRSRTIHSLGANLPYGTGGKRGTDVSSGHKLAAVVVSVLGEWVMKGSKSV